MSLAQLEKIERPSVTSARYGCGFLLCTCPRAASSGSRAGPNNRTAGDVRFKKSWRHVLEWTISRSPVGTANRRLLPASRADFNYIPAWYTDSAAKITTAAASSEATGWGRGGDGVRTQIVFGVIRGMCR